MAEKASTLLNRLEQLKYSYGGGAAAAKLELLGKLERRRLRSADELSRLHECLCFWRAYPDDRQLLRCVENMLAGFDQRADLQRRRARLQDSGIAGTGSCIPYWPSAIRTSFAGSFQLSPGSRTTTSAPRSTASST